MSSPPSYDETVKPGGAPPSYTDLFPMQEIRSQVDQAREEGRQATVPLTVCEILCKSFACGICYIVLAALPVSMIIMGSIYLNDCEIERLIPIFLIVFGCVSLLQTTIHLVKMCVCRKKENQEGPDKKAQGGNCCESLVTVFLFIWIIVGSYYTFRAWENWDDAGRQSCTGDNPDVCCAPPVMYFTFSVLILMYGIAVLVCCCVCFCCCLLGLLAGVTNTNE